MLLFLEKEQHAGLICFLKSGKVTPSWGEASTRGSPGSGAHLPLKGQSAALLGMCSDSLARAHSTEGAGAVSPWRLLGPWALGVLGAQSPKLVSLRDIRLPRLTSARCKKHFRTIQHKSSDLCLTFPGQPLPGWGVNEQAPEST